MLKLNEHGAQGWLPGSGFLSLALPALAIAVVASTASYSRVEKPMLRFKDPRRRRPTPPARPADPAAEATPVAGPAG